MSVRIIKTTGIRQFDKGVRTPITGLDTNDEVTIVGHGMVTGQLVDILGNTGTTPDINGQGQAVTVVDVDTITLDGVDITVAGNPDGTVERFNTSVAGEAVSLAYAYDEVLNNIEVQQGNRILQARTPLADYTDNAGVVFADFAAFLTYMA